MKSRDTHHTPPQLHPQHQRQQTNNYERANDIYKDYCKQLIAHLESLPANRNLGTPLHLRRRSIEAQFNSDKLRNELAALCVDLLPPPVVFIDMDKIPASINSREAWMQMQLELDDVD